MVRFHSRGSLGFQFADAFTLRGLVAAVTAARAHLPGGLVPEQQVLEGQLVAMALDTLTGS
ncbi:hypothetical protein ABZ848_15935 [Streptomyces sp. NPDC047081]|uniref:hypothetical protein n=1 Tax=Streptomyces sp. NPDC047081 TaxID=3154706 RepID=UPI0033F96224